MNFLRAFSAIVLVAASGLSGCGGGSSAAPPPPEPGRPDDYTQVQDPVPVPEVLRPSIQYMNQCANPRTGKGPNGLPYYDFQGTLSDELNFLRAWIDETYLWYREVPQDLDQSAYSNPIDYFAVLKTPLLTASGKPKDQFHFTYPSDQWEALQNAGVALGYGVTWSRNSARAPRMWYASLVEPDSPAAQAGIQRGDQLVSIDGVDFVNGSSADDVARLNAGLAPAHAGEVHAIGFARHGVTTIASLAAADVAEQPVRNVRTIDTAGGKVGYLTFTSHNAVSERELIDAFTTLKAANVSDLVLDMRYNGGGLLYVASELAYMVAGPSATKGKAFERILRNDKLAPSVIPFMQSAVGFSSPDPVDAGTALPALGLRHVTVLTTAGTCSASEAVINGLRGVDVQVDIVGARTCGKPYAFTPTPNCGTTYFAIQIQGANDKGFGDYADGFAPTCTVADDLGHALGDAQEGLLAAALQYRASGQCPVTRAAALSLTPVRRPVEEIAIYPPD